MIGALRVNSSYYNQIRAGPRSAVGNVSGHRCVSDCRSRGREFDPGPVPYFRGDWSWNNFYGHSPPFRWFIQEGLSSVTSESMCTNYWLTACWGCLGKSVVKWTDRPAMTTAVDMGRKANKQTTKSDWYYVTLVIIWQILSPPPCNMEHLLQHLSSATVGNLTFSPPFKTFVVGSSGLLMFLNSLYCKQYGHLGAAWPGSYRWIPWKS